MLKASPAPNTSIPLEKFMQALLSNKRARRDAVRFLELGGRREVVMKKEINKCACIEAFTGIAINSDTPSLG